MKILTGALLAAALSASTCIQARALPHVVTSDISARDVPHDSTSSILTHPLTRRSSLFALDPRAISSGGTHGSTTPHTSPKGTARGPGPKGTLRGPGGKPAAPEGPGGPPGGPPHLCKRGGSCSKHEDDESEHPPAPRPKKSRPLGRGRKGHKDAADALAGLAPRPGETSTEFEKDAKTLREGLSKTAAGLAKKGVQLEGVTTGGAVNVLELKSRPTTHDVDVLTIGAGAKGLNTLRDVINDVKAKDGFPEGYISNALNRMVKGKVQATLAKEAREQGIEVFSEKGLKLWAAPWPYSFASKLHRISGGKPKSHDVDDAIRYLDKMIEGNEGEPVSVEDVQAALARYEIDVTPESLPKALGRVNLAYREEFGGRVGISGLPK